VLTQNALPEALLDRFLGDTRAVAPVGRDDRIGLAVSGGPDSLALLLLANASFTGQVHAATVDHGLRTEAADEAAFVARLCGDLGVPHVTLTPGRKLPRPRTNNSVMARARTLRYALLSDWCAANDIQWLMTAHHADDQLETIVMRLNRGSGVGGLSGIRARNGQVIRPLLGWRHEALVAIVHAAGVEPVDDPSNRDDRFDRARLRKTLAGVDWIDPVAVVRSAAALDQADAALAWACQRIAGERMTLAPGTIMLDATGLPDEIARRLLGGAIRSLNPAARLDGAKLSRVHETLLNRGKGTLEGIMCDARKSGAWIIAIAPPRRPTG
jgi:tRNA(Ile)-lysidine synthase